MNPFACRPRSCTVWNHLYMCSFRYNSNLAKWEKTTKVANIKWWVSMLPLWYPNWTKLDWHANWTNLSWQTIFATLHQVKYICAHKCAWEVLKGAAMCYVNIIKQFINIDIEYELCTHDSEHVCGTSWESGCSLLACSNHSSPHILQQGISSIHGNKKVSNTYTCDLWCIVCI